MLVALREELERAIRELSEELGVLQDLTLLPYETIDIVGIKKGRRVYFYLRGVHRERRETLRRIEGLLERELAFKLIHAYRALCHLEHLEVNLKLCGLQKPVNLTVQLR